MNRTTRQVASHAALELAERRMWFRRILDHYARRIILPRYLARGAGVLAVTGTGAFINGTARADMPEKIGLVIS
jgi:hypothetical protein